VGHRDHHHDGGRAVDAVAAGRAVPGDRPADDLDHRELPRRVGQDARGHRHPGHRAEAQRPRRPALRVLVSDSTGTAQISVTFEPGTDPDIAQVQVQNKLQLAMPQLPQEVQRQGVRVAKSASATS
jgi:uncharacterized membrane protein